MKPARFQLTPRADADLDEAIEYYAGEGVPLVGLLLLDAVEVTGALICDAPYAYTAHPHYRATTEGLRRRTVKGFPMYTLYYRVDVMDNKLLVLGVRVLHGRRDHAVAMDDENPEVG